MGARVELILRGMKPFFNVSDEDILREVIAYDKVGGFLGVRENGVTVAFALVYWPKAALELPQVMHFYSEGSRRATRALVGHVLDKVKEKGYTRLQAVNGSAMSDEVWSRAFKHEGWEIKPVKTVFEFEAVK